MVTRHSYPRILYVSQFWPRTTGSQLRSVNVLRALREMGKVEVAMLYDPTASDDLALSRAQGLEVAHALRLENRGKRGLVDKIRWTLDPRTLYPNGYSLEDLGTRQLLARIDDFDLVWFFKLRSADAFPNAAWRSSVTDIDDVPSTYEATLRSERRPVQRLLSLRNLLSWRRRERLLGERFTTLTVCSEEDRHYLQRLGLTVPIHVVPNGFERPSVEPFRNAVTPPRIGFVGILEYLPNKAGIDWFVRECWPRVKRQLPDARLRLVGLGSDGPLKPIGPDVDGLGWVEDAASEISTWSVTVNPIRMGAGTRVKIAQAFSRKCPIVSTSLGAFGYHPRDGYDMYVADSAEAFSAACVKAIREPQLAAQMAERAWCEFLKKWTWDVIRPSVWAAAEDCLRVGGRGSTPA
jgi:glycosyltransferase involved in cell wall biosynthesis